MSIHGIAIREKKSKKLVDFIKCDFGRTALRVLSGVRHNLRSDLYATEDLVSEEELDSIGKEIKVS